MSEEFVVTNAAESKTDIQLEVSPMPNNRKPKLDWNEVEGAVKYEIYRCDAENAEYQLIFTANTNQYSNTSAEYGVEYSYKVCAVFADGKTGGFSNTAVIKPMKGIPSVTGDIAVSTGKPRLTWNSIEGAKGYEIYRKTDKETNTYAFIFSTKDTQYINTGAQPDNIYYYVVCALFEDGTKSEPSSVIKIKCTEPAPFVRVRHSKEGKPKLVWSEVEGALKYQVFRSETGEKGSYGLFFTTEKKRFINTSVEIGETFWYKVRAKFDDDTRSPFGNVVTATAIEPAADCADIQEEESDNIE